MEQGNKNLPAWVRFAAKLIAKIHNPIIPENPKAGKWYRVPMDGYVASDGSPYLFNFRKGTKNKLMIFLHGGGFSWNAHMAARPISVDAEDIYDVYYFPKATDYGATGSHGILSGKQENPFRDWNIISLPYCTGDFHCGTADFPYVSRDGKEKVLHHHGYTNLIAAIQKAIQWTGSTPDQLVVTGNSAGGFGAALMTDTVMGLFPECKDVTCLVDSGLLYMEDWLGIVRDIWKSPKKIWKRLHGDCFTLDCLKALKEDYGDRIRILLTCSVRDFNLTQVIGYNKTGRLYADQALGKEFQDQLKKACSYLLDQIPGAAVYIFDTPVAEKDGSEMGLTRHCIIPDDVAFTIKTEGKTVMQWLTDCMGGDISSIGLDLLHP